MKRPIELNRLFRSAATALLISLVALGQAQDWSMFGGASGRPGRNNNPSVSGPGAANLIWFKPDATTGVARTLIRDNLSTEVTQAGTWTAPVTAADMANMFYLPQPSRDPNEDIFSGYQAFQSGANTPYLFSYGIPSAPNQPTVKQNSTDTLSTFSWKIEPANVGERTPRNYSLYVWIPQGLTVDEAPPAVYGTGPLSVFSQRFYVYTIQSSNGQVFTDIVDTFLGGTGWVKLGNGGKPTTRTFQYDGTNPIVITLYNTVPRDASGNLTEPTNPGTLINPPKLVYADAVEAVPSIGSYISSPIVSAFDPSTGLGTVHTVAALNQTTVAPPPAGSPAGTPQRTVTTGVVSSYDNMTGTLRWTFTPVSAGNATTSMDNNSADVTIGAGWTTATTAPGFMGTNYLEQAATNTLTSATDVIYNPGGATGTNLHDGTYQIQVWLPGSGGGDNFAMGATYVVDEGATQTTITVNQDAGGGWVALGNVRFQHTSTNPLTVHVTNYSALATDIGRNVMANAIRFIGESNLAINSTPIQATLPIRTTVGGVPTATAVTIVAAEDGRIYCLDSTGDGHGNTTLYWTYPTLPTAATDPNQAPGLDGVGPIAEMPNGFNLSSGLIETVNGQQLLYIASTNGRVYCIDTAGRGDGTTTRIWSYPDDYPAQALPSNLGNISGSLAFANTAAGPTIFVPAPQGRLYALDAAGRTDRTTAVRWAFPFGDNATSAFQTASSPARNANDVPWTAPANALALDQTYAIATPDLNPPGTGASQYLQVVGRVGAAVPVTSTILGIQVRVVRHRTAGDAGLVIKDANVMLVKAGVIQTGTDRASPNAWPDPGATVPPPDSQQLYGGQTDLWGNTWTPADVNDPQFGVAIAISGTGNSATNTVLPSAQIDYVEVRVFFTAPSNVGAILSTPAVAFGNVYFGTAVKPGDDRGRFFAVNQDTGIETWEFNGATQWSTTGAFVNADDFASGPMTIPATELNLYTALLTTNPGQADSVVVANSNRWITSLNAATGALQWTTNELGADTKGSLSYTPLSVLDNSGTGTSQTAPIVMVPTADGRFDGLFALAGTGFGANNRLGSRRAWEYISNGNVTSSMSIGRGFMYGADESGYFYAFSSGSGTTSSSAPGQQGQVENDTGPGGSADAYRQAKVMFVDRNTYQGLRAGTISYSTAIAGQVTRTNFEWGETLYVMVYNYPYDAPPNTGIANFQFDVAGVTQRNLSVQSQQFTVPPPAPTFTRADGSTVNLDGYAVLPYTLQGSGGNALPPGPAEVSISISTSATTSPPRVVSIDLDPSQSKKQFVVANPLALVMQYTDTTDTTPVANDAIGFTPDPADPQSVVNGSPAIGATRYDLLTGSAGPISHGLSGVRAIGVVDRSMMTLLRGPGRGLDNVRIQRADLSWNGGIGAVTKPIPTGTFPNFEDYPINSPNDSLDYPDIRREQVTAVKDPNGFAENPLYSGVTLKPPTNFDPNTESSWATRLLSNTEFDLTVAVPKYQPPNLSSTVDSTGASVPAGYIGQYYAFIDSDGSGVLARDANRREAFRSFWVSNSVPVDERFHVSTPNVDLGSLAQGAGYSDNALSDFSPWTGPYVNMFKKFDVINDGNVNLLNMRLANRSGAAGGSLSDWPISPTANSPVAWLDAAANMRSDIDPGTALTPQVILQKARVGDRSGTRLTTNPVRRFNPNLSVPQGALFTGPTAPAPDSPRVAVSVPFGFPAGTYSQLMRIIEDSQAQDQALNPGETFSDPSFKLSFKVRETTLTGKPQQDVHALVDAGITGTEPFLHTNGQPAAYRDPNGNLIVAWSSTRSAFTAPEPTTEGKNEQYNIYIASMQGAVPGTGPQNPLNDLNGFVNNDTTRWFNLGVGPYPTTSTATLFSGGVVTTGPGGTANTVQFMSPAFPQGPLNPFTGASNGNPYLAFVGQATLQTAPGQFSNENRLFIVRTQIDATGHVTLSDPTPLPDSLQNSALISNSIKQRPFVLQFGANATVFFSTAGSGHGQVLYATFNGTAWTKMGSISVPTGFDSVESPSVTARIYTGFGQGSLQNGDNMLEVAFTGKMKGRSHPDIYVARIKCDANGVPTPQSNDQSDVAVDLTPVSGEVLASSSDPSQYFATGTGWDITAPITLTVNGTDALGANQRHVDPTTGLISFDSPTLGGKVYMDPNAGSVRFAGSTPGDKAVIALTYTPKFLRVSSGATADQYPSMLYDYRNVGDFTGWFDTTNSPAAATSVIATARYVVTYGAISPGAGQAARPYISTYRLGTQLPAAIATNPDGTPVALAVSGNSSFYQMDAVRGRIYFTDVDEGRQVSIVYTDVNGNVQRLDGSAGNLPRPVVSFVPESREAPIDIDGAVNEAQMTTFLDPFNPAPPYSAANPARPGLVWMFWASTRGGAPEIVFQSIAPQYAAIGSVK